MKSNELKKKKVHEGPEVYKNWLAYESGAEKQSTTEFVFLTDSYVTGEIWEGYGYYLICVLIFLNRD